MDRVKEVISTSSVTVTFNFDLLTLKIIGFQTCVYEIQSLYEIQSFWVNFFQISRHKLLLMDRYRMDIQRCMDKWIINRAPASLITEI